MSADGVRNRVYQFEKRRYIERINHCPLEFNSDASSIREFVENKEQKILLLRMFKWEEWTGPIKVHQVLSRYIGSSKDRLYSWRSVNRNETKMFVKGLPADVQKCINAVNCNTLSVVDCLRGQSAVGWRNKRRNPNNIWHNKTQTKYQNHIYHSIGRQDRCVPAPHRQENFNFVLPCITV